MNAARAPVPKLPAGCARPPRVGNSKARSRLSVIATASRQFEGAQQVERDRDGEQEQQHDRSRVLQLECPARGCTRSPQRQQGCAESSSANNRARRIGERIRARVRRTAPRARQVQGLERENREDARHQVEQDPSRERAKHRP
jgi:hypothetical protein